MAAGEVRVIGRADLERAVRSVAKHFGADRVFIVGSQGLLVAREDLDRELRKSREIDLYVANAEDWERDHPDLEASEEINALFGEGSDFHEAHGFFIDGVDWTTAKLASDWTTRSVSLDVEIGDGRTAVAVAPSPADLVAAKLYRGDPKDVTFAAICFRQGLAKVSLVKEIISKTFPDEVRDLALMRLDVAMKSQSDPTAIGKNAHAIKVMVRRRGGNAR